MALAGHAPLPLIDFRPGSSRRHPAEQQTGPADQQQAAARGQANGVLQGSSGSRVRSSQQVNSTHQSILERYATFAQSDTRRFSLRDAIATLEQNQALIADPENPRQISGIIDEYV